NPVELTVLSLVMAYRSFGRFRPARHPPRYAAYADGGFRRRTAAECSPAPRMVGLHGSRRTGGLRAKITYRSLLASEKTHSLQRRSRVPRRRCAPRRGRRTAG